MEDQNGALKIWNRALSSKSKKTVHDYKHAFKSFLEYTGKTPDELRAMKFEEGKQSEPWMQTEVENIVREFIGDLKAKGYSGATIHMKLSAIRSFFNAQNLPLSLRRSDQPMIANEHASSVPSKEQVKSIIECAGTIRDRAIILFLKDSGLRVSDLALLKWRDFKEYGEGFLGFQVTTQKRKVKARGFVGEETTAVLMRYKKQRLMGSKTVKPETNIEDHPLFSPAPVSGHFNNGENPMNAGSIGQCVSKAVKLAGLTHTISAHGLRKFWEQNIHADRESYIKQLNGRALNRVERAYYWRTDAQLFTVYKQNYQHLECLSSPQMIKQEDIERIVEQRVAERVAQLNMHAKEVEAKSHRDIEDLKHQLKRVDRVEMQLAQLFTQQKAGLFIPRKYEEEAFTEIMGSRDKAREVLAKLAEIRKKRKS